MKESRLKKRDQITIIFNLLELLNTPMRITRLIRSMNLNWNYVIKYLNIIDELGLISFNDKEYSLTPKGKEFYLLMKK